MRSAARFDWSGRLLKSLEPQYEKPFWPVEELVFDILRSVAVFLKLYLGLVEFATTKSNRYCGTVPFIDLNTVIF